MVCVVALFKLDLIQPVEHILTCTFSTVFCLIMGSSFVVKFGGDFAPEKSKIERDMKVE